MITLENLTTGYRTGRGERRVTRNINATLTAGRMTCLLGPNGAGKSTLLRTLSAFQPPLEGEITLDGASLRGYSDRELSRKIGVVLTERIMVSEMSVEELIGMGRAPYTGFWGRLSGNDRRIVERAIELTGTGHLRQRTIHSLSDGERQKVLIAKALAQETPLILLDEPTAYLDYPSKVEVMRLLHSLTRSEGKTVFLSTHDLELALQIADTVWLIDKEHGLTVGTPEDVALRGELTLYFERPGIEFDMEAGVFRPVPGTASQSVRLHGRAELLPLTAKALRRSGFAPGAEGPVIEAVSPHCFRLDGKEYDSIGGLLDALGAGYSASGESAGV